MKKTFLLISFSVILISFAESCTKSSYSSTDETTGIVNTTKLWSGYSTGYFIGDTVLAGDTTHIAWAKYYYHVINDSSFAVQKVNNLLISILGMPLAYKSTNATTHMELFDSTIAGTSLLTKLEYYSNTGNMNYEYHKVGAYNAASGHYYETNIFIHTP